MDDDEHLLGRTCCYPGCGDTLHDHSPVEVCRVCGMKIARVFEVDLQAERNLQHARNYERGQAKQGNREGSVVYYVRIADYIKIGYTTRLRERLRGLRVEPQELLAVEPGGQELEAQRHREFGWLRLSYRWENFALDPALFEWMAALKEEHGLPSWAKLPDTSVVTRRRVT